MLTDLEKRIIIYAAADCNGNVFNPVQFVEANSEFKAEAVYAALNRLATEGYLSSFREKKGEGAHLQPRRFYQSTEPGKHIATGLQMLQQEQKKSA